MARQGTRRTPAPKNLQRWIRCDGPDGCGAEWRERRRPEDGHKRSFKRCPHCGLQQAWNGYIAQPEPPGAGSEHRPGAEPGPAGGEQPPAPAPAPADPAVPQHTDGDGTPPPAPTPPAPSGAPDPGSRTVLPKADDQPQKRRRPGVLF